MAKDVVKIVRPEIEKIVSSQNLNLFDLEFVKEDNVWFLRVSIEKEDGSMDFETAEVISSLVSAKLDELDPIEHEYILDVCSPGAERPIRNKDEFIANLNRYITVYLTNKDENNKEVEIGYCLSRAWWNKGITTEALAKLIQFFFEEVKVDKIVAKHDINNPASGKVMIKNNMKHEKTLSNAATTSNNELCDVAYYSIIKSNY